MLAGDRLVAADLLLESLRYPGEALGILGRPPVAQQAVAVARPPLVVEQVRNLVADDRAHGAVVNRRIGVRIEGRGLHDGGEEDDLVPRRVGVGIHQEYRLQEDPVIRVPRQPAEVFLADQSEAAAGVADRVAAPHIEGARVAPDLGVEQLDTDLGELVAGPGAGFRRHPFELRQPRVEGGDQVVDHRLGRGLGVGRHVALDVGLAHHVGERALLAAGVEYRLDPALLRFLLPPQLLAVEREDLVARGLGQVLRGSRDGHVAHVVLPCLKRFGRDQLCHADDRRGGGHVDHGRRADAGTGEVPAPVDARGTLRELGRTHHVVLLYIVAQLGGRPGDLRDLRLQCLHVPRPLFGIVETGDLEQACDVGALRLQDGGIGGVEIEVA